MRCRWLLPALTLPLAADAALRVAAVERTGWPPFEDDRRIYRLEGQDAGRLRPGEVVQLFRPGDPRDPGRLKVAFLEGGRASAFLDARGSTYPLVGDLALGRRVATLPTLPATAGLADLGLRPPVAPPAAEVSPSGAAATPQAPPQPLAPRHETIYFLEGDGSLSPKGRDKLQVAVRSWGAEGRWVLAVPVNQVLPEKVRAARIQAIRKALGGFGVGKLDLKEVPRRDGDTGDVVYIEKG